MSNEAESESAFVFKGTWREYAPIAFTNLLLIIVTLGFYRFWAKTRERQYLWSRTNFIGDPLEWTGTGKELFIGFTLVAILLFVPIIMLQLGIQALALRGHFGMAGLAALLCYGAILYVFGIARYRAIRYRLSRSLWHGIRGGSDDQGWRYGVSALWKPVVGSFAVGLLIPWSMTSLWNERWGKMSFGSLPFEAKASHKPLLGRFLLFYLLPIVGCVGGVAAFAVAGGGPPSPGSFTAIILGAIIGYALLGVIAIVYYAAFLREAIGELTLHEIGFDFTARTIDWIKLMLGTTALVIVTLGVGYVFVGYRNWAFFMRHLEARGEVSLADLKQSTTATPTQGEGLLDAFDIGAF